MLEIFNKKPNDNVSLILTETFLDIFYAKILREKFRYLGFEWKTKLIKRLEIASH
jgi:hypothetical protein